MQLPWDVMVQERLMVYMRRLYATATVQSTLAPLNTEVLPGITSIPANASSDVWGSYIKQNLAPVWHAVGTAGMRKREWGGVVDERFRVYGVNGLRVVDASVIPLEINGNPTSTIYALAEKAAEDILGSCE